MDFKVIAVIFLFAMSAFIFVKIYEIKRNTKDAILASLIFAKMYVIVLYIFKIDTVLFHIDIINKKTGSIKTVAITANILVLFFFFLAVVSTLALKYLDSVKMNPLEGI